MLGRGRLSRTIVRLLRGMRPRTRSVVDLHAEAAPRQPAWPRLNMGNRQATDRTARGRQRSGLTARQRQFVDEYLIDLNATQAAIRAGYSPRTARSIGSENLTKPDIQAAVERAMAERGKRARLTADEVLDEVARIAFSDIRDIDFGPDGRLVELQPGAARTVASYGWSHQVQRGGVRLRRAIRLWNKLAALRLLMQHLGLLDPKCLPTLEAVLALFPPTLRAEILKYIAESPPEGSRVGSMTDSGTFGLNDRT